MAHRVAVALALSTLAVLSAGTVPSVLPGVSAQWAWPWCNEFAEPPADDFESAGIGLMRSELTVLYGPGEEVQDRTHYPRDGYELISQDCDIVVQIDPDGPYGEAEAARELARTLLPPDAILVGFWALGNRGASGPLPQDAEEWISGSLASRYRLLGEGRSGSILVVYDYSGTGFDLGSVERIELRSAQIPRVLATPSAD